jgi:hypothetical protein
MSPEQTMGKRLDGRSDVFSLALVCWELLAGRVALDRTDPVEAMKCIRDGKLPSIRQVRPDTPPPLAHILEQALAVRPTNRLSAFDFGNALEGYIKSSPELGTSMQLSEWVRTRFHQGPAAGDQPYDPAASYPPAAAPAPSRRAPTRPAAAGEIAAPTGATGAAGATGATGGGVPAFDPKASFLQDVDDDDALTQITSQPTQPARDPARVPRAHLPGPSAILPPPGPNTTIPPMMAPAPGATMAPGPNPLMPSGPNPLMPSGPNPIMAPMAMPAGNSWSRFTGTFLLHTRRRRIVATVIVLIVIALAMSSNEATPRPEGEPGTMAAAGDAGTQDGMGEPDAAPDAGPEDDAGEGEVGAERAWLEVITQPKGALVTLDDRDPVESPAVFEDLDTGEHAIAIEHEGYRDVESTVTLEPGVKTLEFELDRQASRAKPTRKGTLSVVTRPSSQVYMGKRKLDTTPFANKRLTPGTYMLTFKKSGYRTEKKKVTIRPGETTKLNFSLRKR